MHASLHVFFLLSGIEHEVQYLPSQSNSRACFFFFFCFTGFSYSFVTYFYGYAEFTKHAISLATDEDLFIFFYKWVLFLMLGVV